MLREMRGDIRLTLDRRHWVLLPAQHESRALNLRKSREEVERVTLAPGPCEPTRHFGMPDGASDRVRIARSPTVEWGGTADPGLQGGCVRVPFEEPAAGQGADLGSAEALEQRDPALTVRPAGGLGVSENKLGGSGRIAGRIRQGHRPAERHAQDDRAYDAERLTEGPHVVAPLGQGPACLRAWIAAAVPTLVHEHDLGDI